MTPSAAIATPTAKGASTRGMLLERACGMAARVGLEGVTIGELASAAGMSKSGVFAHFGSREDLVRQTLDWAAGQFIAEVMAPSLKRPRGLPRLQAIAEAWIGWIAGHPDGCVFLGAAMEYDGRPGPMRDHVVRMLESWRAALERAVALAVEQGHLRAGTDPALVAFQLQALMQGLHHARLHQPQAAQDLVRRAVADLFDRYRADAVASSPRTSR
ncbi:TetR/AcrR family transcriptional regulator [Pseudoxanthomonas suwonensis]|uniref:TetR family transcriptional regulator n=1 Tax=Pseudoxanthomonas suwonensis TaxID=314722 RepID=A0A0E3Z2T0_9GAMM|nr:TetR/AcrR family transcriptional regulator [Pseudoxanthomonas suwonensis]AKC87932.1 TetR family transcriptional regulator [Pseudoxanthomonas suwonensis]